MVSSGVDAAATVVLFQAEDGIRDIGVTGVQTCALPICDTQRIWLRPPVGTIAGQREYVISRRIEKRSLQHVGASLVKRPYRLALLGVRNADPKGLLFLDEFVVYCAKLPGQVRREQFYSDSAALQLPDAFASNALIRIQNSDEDLIHASLIQKLRAAIEGM